jgi:hypothetical protein
MIEKLQGLSYVHEAPTPNEVETTLAEQSFATNVAVIDRAYSSENEAEIANYAGHKVDGGTDPGNIGCHWSR